MTFKGRIFEIWPYLLIKIMLISFWFVIFKWNRFEKKKEKHNKIYKKSFKAFEQTDTISIDNWP